MQFFCVQMHLKFVLLIHKVISGLISTIEKEEVILEKSLAAEEKLNIFLDQVFDNLQLEPK